MSKEKLVPELRFPEFKNEGEWEETILGSVVEMKGRIGYRGYTTEDIVDKGKGAITLSPSNFKENGQLNFDKCTYISWEKYDESPEIQLEEGQTVLVKTASVGKTAYVDKLPEKATVNPQIVVLKPKTIHNRFLSFTVSHQNTQIQFRNNVGAGAIPNISQEIISKIKILIPPDLERKEQQKIASCLSSLDEVIAAHSQKLELLKDHKKGLMQNLFPNSITNYESSITSEDDTFVIRNSETRNLPKYRFKEFEKDGEWVEEPFHKVYSFFVTNSFSREFLNYNNGAVKNIHYGDIHTKFSTLFDLTKESVPFINPEVSIERIREECYCKEGDIIFADASEDLNDVGKSIEIVNLNGQKLLSGLHTLMARQIEQKLEIGFGGYLFKSERIKQQIQREAQGAKVLGISGTRISNIQIYYPKNPKEQQKIATCLSSLDSLITAQAEKIEELKLHKKGLMQGLFPKSITN